MGVEKFGTYEGIEREIIDDLEGMAIEIAVHRKRQCDFFPGLRVLHCCIKMRRSSGRGTPGLWCPDRDWWKRAETMLPTLPMPTRVHVVLPWICKRVHRRLRSILVSDEGSDSKRNRFKTLWPDAQRAVGIATRGDHHGGIKMRRPADDNCSGATAAAGAAGRGTGRRGI